MKISPANIYTKNTFVFSGHKRQNNINNKELTEDIYSNSGDFLIQFQEDEIPIEYYTHNCFNNQKTRKSTFRDEELFDEKTDILITPGYSQYSVDDVPLRDDLSMRYGKEIADYNRANGELYPETSIIEDEIINKNCYYWINTKKNEAFEEQLNEFMNIAIPQIRRINPDGHILSKIFKNCTIYEDGEDKKNLFLCSLAVKLFMNSKDWGKLEEKIINELKIPLYAKKFGTVSYVKYKSAFDDLKNNCTNEEILMHLRQIRPIDIYGLTDYV